MISFRKEEPWKKQLPLQSRNLGLLGAEDSAPRPSSEHQPRQNFCFIDEQRLRQPGENPFRKAVRSQARRATDQRRQRFNATTKPNNPRKLLVKSQQPLDAATFPNTDICAATPQPGNQLVVDDNGLDKDASTALHGPLGTASPCTVRRRDEVEENIVTQQAEGIGTRQAGQNQYELNNRRKSLKWTDVLSEPRGHKHRYPGSCVFESSQKSDTNQDSYRNDGRESLVTFWQSLDAGNTLISGCWRRDPFDAYSVLKNPRSSLLLAYYHEMISNMYVNDVHKALWDFKLAEPTLLHAVMLFSAYHLGAMTHSVAATSDSLHHRGEVMSLINGSLEDPVLRVSDKIVGALCLLIMFEEMYGSQGEVETHRKGLRQILRLRVRMKAPEMFWFTQQLISLSEPDLDRAESINENSLEGYEEISESTISLGNGSLSKIPPDAMLDVFSWLKNTAQQVSAQSPTSDLKKKVSYVVRKKIQVYLRLLPNRDKSQDDRYSHAWLLASLIYLHTIVAFPDELAGLPGTERALVSQLKEMLESLGEALENDGYPCRVLVWVLLFGGLHAQGPEALWFRSALDTTCTIARLSTWEKVKVLLKDLPWVQSDMEQKLYALYLCRGPESILGSVGEI